MTKKSKVVSTKQAVKAAKKSYVRKPLTQEQRDRKNRRRREKRAALKAAASKSPKAIPGESKYAPFQRIKADKVAANVNTKDCSKRHLNKIVKIPSQVKHDNECGGSCKGGCGGKCSGSCHSAPAVRGDEGCSSGVPGFVVDLILNLAAIAGVPVSIHEAALDDGSVVSERVVDVPGGKLVLQRVERRGGRSAFEAMRDRMFRDVEGLMADHERLFP